MRTGPPTVSRYVARPGLASMLNGPQVAARGSCWARFASPDEAKAKG